MSIQKTSAKFWQGQTSYPGYSAPIKHRRFHELMHLVPMLGGVESLLDIGCGDGALLRALREVTEISELTGCDFACQLYGDGHGPGNWFRWDAYGSDPLPPVDFALCCGVAPFLTDVVFRSLLGRIAAPQLFLRAPCAGERVEIDGYSEALGADYAAIYRTRAQLDEMLESEGWEVTRCGRLYPDAIESEFGTKQWYFQCNAK